jgi:hypothetical protein
VQSLTVADIDTVQVHWEILAETAGVHLLRLEVKQADSAAVMRDQSVEFLPPVPLQPSGYIPEPKPVQTSILVGAHNCPLWEADKTSYWNNVLKHPERTPALGFYAQESPEVADWETKWAVEHGVNFFVYCWYRSSQGGPVTMNYRSGIHDALFKSRFVNRLKFTIMWENQSKGRAGVADERDLMENLLPFWLENYFKHPGYLKVDNKPLLFIYRPEFLVADLGGEAQVVKAFNLMREACRKAGFDGLYLLGEYRGMNPAPLQLLKRLGLDYSFAYCWPISGSPAPDRAVATQVEYIRKTQKMGVLPQVVTVSQAWSGWRDEGSIWKIPPAQFETLLREAKQIIAGFPAQELGRKMLLLDNWNEWGEGHYLAPYREYGFGYLDAVRRVFSDAPESHVDLIPEDVGRGPYDTAYRKWAEQDRTLRQQASRRILKGQPEAGLVGWWTFDEAMDAPVAQDASGNRLGGLLRNAGRVASRDGHALRCDGGSVEIPSHPLLSPGTNFTLECWVKTDAAGQANNWIINRVLSGSTSAGYRLGVLQGNPSFEVPHTEFSHHLRGPNPLPTGRWIHLAGTFDGQDMKLYMDGVLQGTMSRAYPLKPCHQSLILGNYANGHSAYFQGLLDEVRLYHRCLTTTEILKHSQAAQ